MRQNDGFIAPKLPKALLDQVGNGGSNNKRNRVQPTRKQRRKTERQQKKVSQRPKMRPTPSLNRDRQQSNDYDEDDTPTTDYEYSGPPPKYVTKPSKTPTASDGQAIKSILKKTKKADPKPSRGLSPSTSEVRPISRAVKDRLASDDAEIAALEKKLGMKGKKKLPKSFEEDGLDDLLEGLDGDSENDGKKRKRSEDDEWLKQKRRRVQQSAVKETDQPTPSDGDDDDDDADDDDGSDEDDEELDEDELDFDEDDEDDDQEASINLEMDAIDNLLDGLGEDSAAEDEEFDDDDDANDTGIDDMDGDEQFDDDEDEDAFESFDDGSDEDDEEESEPPPPRQRENPYIAPVSATSASATPVAPAGKYVPPSLRGPPSSDAEAIQRLRRQIQGLLNRLSEANLISILQSVEKIYSDNPRQYVTSTLIDLLLGLICDRTSLQDTFLILHAGFIAALYKVIGIDFGAQVIERIVNDFDQHYSPNDQTSGKETANLMSLLSELYNFGVVGGNLVFDYIRLFLNTLSEPNTELLLKIIRNSGPQLRSEDPSALKDIVLLLQKQVSAVGEANLSVRTKFMIETINSLKNNRMKTGAAASAVVSEHITRMKKTVGTLNNRSTLKASEPLRIGLADIRDTDKKGKWWLVGASWMDPGKHETDKAKEEREEQQQQKKSSSTSTYVDTTILANDVPMEDLLSLAREQGMNTDVRRAIFVTLLSAADFTHAHIQLMKLNLKKAQELEIPRVLIHCVGSEGTYNPYYVLVAKKFCREKRMLKAFQFGLWDSFKRMGERGDDDDSDVDNDDEAAQEMTMRKIVNLGKFFSALIVDAELSITCLKTLSFTHMAPKTTTFLEVLLTTTILSCIKKSKKAPRWDLALQDVFSKAHDVPDMVQGLRYFIETVVAKADLAQNAKEKNKVLKGVASVVEALLLGMASGGVEGSDDEMGTTSGSDSD